MSRLGWKLLAAVGATLLALTAFGAFSVPETVEPYEWWQMALDSAVVTGTVGYSWRLKLGRSWIWKIVFMLQSLRLLALVLGAVFAFLALRTEPAVDSHAMVPFAILVLGFSLLQAYCLFQYGYREDRTWTPNSRLQRPAAA